MKTCKNGEQCVHPNGPVLPESEFYPRRHDCKECHKKAVTSKPSNAPRRIVGELAVDAALHRMSMYGVGATRGRDSQFKHVDVVAWGFVRIEIKTSQQHSHGLWHFSFGSQVGKGIKADLVVLVPLDNDLVPIMYSVFPASFPKFFNKEGRLKQGMQLYTTAAHRKSGYSRLTMHDMKTHEDKWSQVDDTREVISNQLKHGVFNPRRVNHPKDDPPPMFGGKSA